ncbi:MAG: preprotein translocase subunit SecG [bacterium]
MIKFISYLQIILSVLLIISIILQIRGVGLSPTFGGLTSGGETFRQRRGLEKFLMYATMVLIALIAVSSIALIWLDK